ncbi:MAG: hypothetical protein MUD01_06375 [Chloroflexaceae bacterium]|nr:hypothetical protein [Chloroflexaceae bacterium]
MELQRALLLWGGWLLILAFAMWLAALLLVPTVWSGPTTAYANMSGPLPQAYGLVAKLHHKRADLFTSVCGYIPILRSSSVALYM